MLQALLLSHLAASGFATGSRSPAELSAFELADTEHRPLLVPEQRQLAGSLQPLGGEGDQLGALEDRLDQGKVSHTRHYVTFSCDLRA
jgi:hypothetical protein